MPNIKNTFSTTDLACISGIKAHTIRIWEKRYSLFTPEKTENNVRQYNLSELRKLLNVALLQKSGHKISKIAAFSDEEIITKAKALITLNMANEWGLNQLKLAMYSFDSQLFEQVYAHLAKEHDFRNIFVKVFAPFLYFVGDLWQTEAISPAHEHFISNLIYQKIQTRIDALEINEIAETPVYVLYLPEEEMHEIALLYLNYELKSKGYRTIYLGRAIPIQDLEQIKSLFPAIYWVGVFTMTVAPNFISDYFIKIEELLKGTDNKFWGISHSFQPLAVDLSTSNIQLFHSIEEVINGL